MIDDEPKRPVPSEDVRVWLEDHLQMTVATMVLDELTPPEVREWARAHETWRAAHEAWRALQRLDVDLIHPRWRMLGGPWLSLHDWMQAECDGQRVTVAPLQWAQAASLSMDDAQFAAWVATFYELHDAHERVRFAFVKHIAAGNPPLFGWGSK